jgi:endonuclease/exonuclease/phosphatase family metal-dependent hydrolase
LQLRRCLRYCRPTTDRGGRDHRQQRDTQQMPSFPKPRLSFRYRTDVELRRLRAYRDTMPGRAIPSPDANRLRVATWNIANLGGQERREKDYRLLAEIIGWFDIVAIQETKNKLTGIRGIQEHLPDSWSVLFSDTGGNNERMAFLFDSAKVTQLEKIGEIAVPPKDSRFIKLPGIDREFPGFDRNPYLAAFSSGALTFVLVNVHLFFGSSSQADVERRALEAYATARWADLRRKSPDSYASDIIALGDFNLPKVEPGDLIYKALHSRGLERPPHSTKIASSISTDAEYDQVMFFPRTKERSFTGNVGVFDFDSAVFRGLWDRGDCTPAGFRSYVRYFLSDHRPLWAELRTN